MTLNTLKSEWVNTPEYHAHINDLFTELVNKDDRLREHRDWVQNNIFGFGEKSFWWLWKLICEELPERPYMMEIGIFKGATLSLWHLLKPKAFTCGISPMNGAGTGWTEDDYWGHLNTIFGKFNAETKDKNPPIIIEGLSQADNILTDMNRLSLEIGGFNMIYVDGDHSYSVALSDLTNYSRFIKPGGYLVIDDCNCDLNFPPTGYFTGIAEVTQSKIDWLATNPPFEFVFSVVHISVYRRL